MDHGPIAAVQARLGEVLFGDSVFGIRVLSALAGAVAVFLTGVITWALGGRRPAQALAMFGLIACPQYIGTDGYLSMNSFEPVFWMSCVLAVLLLVRGRSQFFADRFGWQQEAGIVRKTFLSLPLEDRERVCIFGSNYGNAGAIDFLDHLKVERPSDTLPPAMSGQSNYWLWGTHGCDPDLVVAVLGDTPEEISKKYVSVEVAGRLDNPWAMPYEHKNIYLLRGRRSSAPFNWKDERFYF